MTRTSLAAGAALALGARAALVAGLKAKFVRDVKRLDGGDYSTLLSGYADDAVLRFNDGDHRWAGDHVGRPAIERFLEHYTAAGLQGTIRDFWIAGPPWALRLVARFDDHTSIDGRRVYENRTCVVLRTRWGKIVEHEDFYEDTGRILGLERALQAAGR